MHAPLAHAIGHLFQPGQRQDVVVAGLTRSLEHLAQAVPDQVLDLIFGCVVGQAFQELGEVLLPIEVVASFWRMMQIPRNFLELLEGREEFGRLA